MSTTVSFEQARALLAEPNSSRIVAYPLVAVEEVFGVRYSEESRKCLRVVPFSDDFLERGRGKYVLFPSFPMSVQGMWARFPELFHDGRPTFSSPELPTRWHLVETAFHIEPYENDGKIWSGSKSTPRDPIPEEPNWEEIVTAIFEKGQLPSTALLTFISILHLKHTCRWLHHGSAGLVTSDMSWSRGGGENRCHYSFFRCLGDTMNFWRDFEPDFDPPFGVVRAY